MKILKAIYILLSEYLFVAFLFSLLFPPMVLWLSIFLIIPALLYFNYLKYCLYYIGFWLVMSLFVTIYFQIKARANLKRQEIAAQQLSEIIKKIKKDSDQ